MNVIASPGEATDILASYPGSWYMGRKRATHREPGYEAKDIQSVNAMVWLALIT